MLVIAWVVVAVLATTSPVNAAVEPVVITLTQTGCQFIEPESEDHKFVTQKSADCVAANSRTSEKRLKASKPLVLQPGDYLFRVENRDVPYVLGFWLRGKGLSRLTLPSISGGGIKPAGYKEYAITLTEGEYLYSCPLNPTPDYLLVVK